jgi:transposase
MIHHIKSLYADGQGQSIRSIAAQLKVSRNTVRKYLRSGEAEISQQREDPSRSKRLDAYRQQIVHQLQRYPRLSAVKVLRKLRSQGVQSTFSDRTLRRYIESLRESVTLKQARYYMPVMDMVPGVQCQVDPGELRGVSIGGKECTVYFVVFVLSYSRLMYVSVNDRPISTSEFIRMHDSAFRYFGGCPEECVFDQTKLVVIREEYRELTLNERFNEYASHARFDIRACEGYDPESKGKVEAGVKYVKGNALYGESFDDWTHLRSYMADWLDTIANIRIHGTTGIAPQQLYDKEERSRMQPYLTPAILGSVAQITRKVDKTGLISWKSNKYSVPMAYQRCTVGVRDSGSELHVDDLENGLEITCHTQSLQKGVVIRNTDHYRDRVKQISDYEHVILTCIGDDYGNQLCALLKITSPKIYKDQLAGAGRILSQHTDLPATVLDRVLSRPRLSATGLRDYLDAYAEHSERLEVPQPALLKTPSGDSDLARYASLTAQENPHELH